MTLDVSMAKNEHRNDMTLKSTDLHIRMFIAEFEDFLLEVMCCCGHRIKIEGLIVQLNDRDRVEICGL